MTCPATPADLFWLWQDKKEKDAQLAAQRGQLGQLGLPSLGGPPPPPAPAGAADATDEAVAAAAVAGGILTELSRRLESLLTENAGLRERVSFLEESMQLLRNFFKVGMMCASICYPFLFVIVACSKI